MGLNPQGYVYGEEPTNTNPFWDEESGAIASLTATASVDNTTGTPNVEVTKSGTPTGINFNFAFAGLKGQKGDPGTDGANGTDGATPDVTASASVDNTTGTPNVEVTKSGTDAAPNFNFAFTGLKGPKGDKGDPGSGGGIEIPKIKIKNAYNQSSIFPTEEGYKSTPINFTNVTVSSGTLEEALNSGNYELRLSPLADSINGYMSIGEKLLFINEMAVVTPKFTAYNYTTQKSYTATDVTCYCSVRPDNQVVGNISMKWEESTNVDYSQYLQYTPKGTFFTLNGYATNPLFTVDNIIALINADISGDKKGYIELNLSDTNEEYDLGVDTRSNILGGGQQFDSLSIMNDYILGKQSFYMESDIKLVVDENAMMAANPEDIEHEYSTRWLIFRFPEGMKAGSGLTELVPLGTYGGYNSAQIFLGDASNVYQDFYIKDSTTGKIYNLYGGGSSFQNNDITFTITYQEYTPNA